MRARTGSRRARQRGFTMIEVMVAILLTAIAIIGILALFMAQSRASAYSRHTSEASVLAEDGLEKLRATATPANETLTDVDERGQSPGIYTRTAVVSALIGAPPSAYYDIQVVVTWDEDGVARSVTLNGRRNQ